MSTFDDLNTRADAYRGVDEDGVPNAWTPEYCQVRMIEMFDVVTKTGGRVGPKSHGVAWPEVLREFSDFVGYEHKQYMADRRSEISRQADRTFSSIELSRADEAMVWAARYLAHSPIDADALQLWALCKARKINIAGLLRARALAADKLRDFRSKSLIMVDGIKAAHADRAVTAERKIAAAREERRRKALATTLAWANERLAAAKDAEHAARIRANARVRFERAMMTPVKAGAATELRRCDVMPGRVFSESRLDHYRARAAALLCKSLRRDGVPVR